jgi:hypothetical protein
MAEKSKKEQELTNALAEHNLTLRDDSRLCKEWIDGVCEHNLETVVKIMRQMDWLYTFTTYEKIYAKYMDTAYENAKSFIRDAYGWLPYDEYQEELEDHVDKYIISEKAKRAALRMSSHIEIPEFMKEYR